MTDTNRAQQIAALEQELAALQASLATPGLPPAAQQTLQRRVAEITALLAALRSGSGGRSVISFGNNSQFGDITIGDVAGGSIYKGNVTYGPTVTGPISSGRDTNIATEQTITNYAGGAEPPRPPAAPVAEAPGPRLRLALTDLHNQPLSTLTVGTEARLAVTVEGDAEVAQALDLTLVAEGAVDWPEGTRRTLRLSPGQPAPVRRWSLTPLRAGAVELRVAVLRGEAAVQTLTLLAQSQAAGTGVLSGPQAVPVAPPPVTGTVGMSLSAAADLPAQGAALTLTVRNEGNRYALHLPTTGDERTLAVTASSLADRVAQARAWLLALINHDDGIGQPFLSTVTLSPAFAQQALTRLAQIGGYLWDSLFDAQVGGADMAALGDALRARSRAEALQITISGDLIGFPWHLLYDGSTQEVTPDGFWGLRHSISIVPTRRGGSSVAASLRLRPADSLELLAGYNRSLSPLGTTLIDDQRMALAAKVSQARRDELYSEAELLERLQRRTDTDILMLFCHGLSGQPGQASAGAVGIPESRLILTRDDQALTLANLEIALRDVAAPVLPGGPLVLLNACGSAALSPLSYDGFAPFLLGLGARAVIGTESNVPTVFGAAFGPELLGKVLTGTPVGTALRETRRFFWETHRNPLGLLYNCYGVAGLHVPTEAR
jgi:hypothetical protein